MKRFLMTWLILMIGLSAFAQRKALVIGNASFEKNSMPSSINDAQLATDALKALDFTVVQKTNLDYNQFNEALDQFKKTLSTGDVAVFYYSGFAKQECGKNYLMPNSSAMKKSSELISVDVVLEAISRATESFLFLETRQIPESFFKNPCGKNKGLAAIQKLAANQGFAMASGTGEELRARDSKYSIFTHALFKNMTEEMQDFGDLMQNTVRDVKAASKNNQTPYWKSNLKAPFSFYHPEQPLKFRFRLPSYNSLEGGGSYNF
ncbi:MAG: caspase family protein [Candidatus Cloacimonetes bacterium]|nr:caspase family protein [Candidatus Cloacimonadota bacterium]